ncbi:nuclear transport factor 2 family protein, partial [Aphanothece microscopica]|uniref:nuclear transport factor 2 family protein n=1 Tax=Aphanothece microscopica TaxID=1049561 RepID=UPI00398540F6
MKLIYLVATVVAMCFLSPSPSCAQNQEKEALKVAEDFFEALEKADTTAFYGLFLPKAMVYTVRETNGQPVLGSRSPFSDKFRPGTVIKERMKDTGVEVHVHGRMAVVWAPYNLWVNDVFSHCGVDVFNLIRTDSGWKIASLSY